MRSAGPCQEVTRDKSRRSSRVTISIRSLRNRAASSGLRKASGKPPLASNRRSRSSSASSGKNSFDSANPIGYDWLPLLDQAYESLSQVQSHLRDRAFRDGEGT